MSFSYFDTLDEAINFEPPLRYDFMGYPKKQPRTTIKELVGGKPGSYKYKKVDGIATITFGRGKIKVKL